MSDILQVIITILGSSAVATLITVLASRRKEQADVSGKYQDIALKQASENERLHQCQEQLEARVGELERALVAKDNRITDLEASVTKAMTEAEQNEDYIQVLTGYVEQLVTIMQAAGLKPPAKPRRK